MVDNYTTVQGDTWDLILYKIHGEGAEIELDKLLVANPEHRETLFFSGNVELLVPKLTTPYKLEPVPPWQK